MEWSQPDFLGRDHTEDDRETLEELLQELTREGKPVRQEPAEETEEAEQEQEPEEEQELEEDDSLPFTMKMDQPAEEQTAGFDRGSHHVVRYQSRDTERITPEKPTRRDAGVREQSSRGEYTGFLMIDCQQCGNRHPFNAKVPISTYRCKECGGATPLGKLNRLRLFCECGRSYGYKTNINTDEIFDVNCLNCGSPVAMEWSEKRDRYEPVDFGKRKQNNGRRKK